MLPVRFLPPARREFDDARDWYEEQSAGLGDEFETAIHEKLLSIRQHPDMYSCVEDDIREAPVSRFPYVVYFWAEDHEIIVASVFHQSRDPAVWQGRFKS